MSDNPNPVTFNPTSQDSSGLDPRAAAQALVLYGLDPTDQANTVEFARHFTEDANRNDPMNRDRYSRAAQATATAKRQAEAMRALGSLEDQRLANDQDAIWKIANYKAPPITEQTKRVQSVLDTIDPGELWRMSQGKGDAVPDTINDETTAAAWRKMQDAGITIDERDPEAKLLDTSTPAKFLDSVDKAIQAKQAKSIYEINDPDQLWELAKKQGLI